LSGDRLGYGKPNVARVYNALLGGKDNYSADRAMAEELILICPGMADMARENRAFVHRPSRARQARGSASSPTWAPACR